MNFNSYFQSFLRFFRDGGTLRPRRDWFLLLAAAALLMLLSIGMNALLFLKVENGEALSDTAAAPAAESAHSSTVTAVQAIFSERASTAATYQSDPHFVDPSH